MKKKLLRSSVSCTSEAYEIFLTAKVFIISVDMVIDNAEFGDTKDETEFIEAALALQTKKYSSFLSYSILNMYTLLESYIKDLVISIFEHYGENIFELPLLKQFEKKHNWTGSKCSADKLQKLYIDYERKFAIGEKYGVDRFEKLLAPLSLSVEKHGDYVERNILELSQLRNCIMHNRGRADKRLLNNCEWLRNKYSIGDDLIFTVKDLDEYAKAIMIYDILLGVRVNNFLDPENYDDYFDGNDDDDESLAE